MKPHDFIPFALPTIEDEEIDEVVDTLKSGWLSIGPKTALFETQFAEYIGVPYAVGLNSCTAALHLALLAHDIGPGDEVILPSFTFAATANMVEVTGARPVFADIDRSTYVISPEDIEKKLTPKTKAVIPVHFAGYPSDLSAITKIAKKNHLVIIEDAAHAVGSEYKGIKVGDSGNTACFSFYATKNMSTGEGGMLTTSNKNIYEFVIKNRLHGISKDAWRRYQKGGSWKYEVLYAGWKYNMTDLDAALGIHQLKKLDLFIQRRADIVHRYITNLKNITGIYFPKTNNQIRHAHHLFTIEVSINRDHLIDSLAKMNIGTSVHFIPLHLMPYYRERYGYKNGDLPVTEAVFSRIISLPLYPRLSDKDVDYICENIITIINRET